MTITTLFFDLDDTLCDTQKADEKAIESLICHVKNYFNEYKLCQQFANRYLAGIYKTLSTKEKIKLLPIHNEEIFRIDLIKLIAEDLGCELSEKEASSIQRYFDQQRQHHLDFYPQIQQWLLSLRSKFKLVVITNGPVFSQKIKIEAVNLSAYVDHILIGGAEKEQKPAVSIFEKALLLSESNPSQVIHFGDKLETDVLGANRAGIHSVWISHGKNLVGDIKPKDILLHSQAMIDYVANFYQS